MHLQQFFVTPRFPFAGQTPITGSEVDVSCFLNPRILMMHSQRISLNLVKRIQEHRWANENPRTQESESIAGVKKSLILSTITNLGPGPLKSSYSQGFHHVQRHFQEHHRNDQFSNCHLFTFSQSPCSQSFSVQAGYFSAETAKGSVLKT